MVRSVRRFCTTILTFPSQIALLPFTNRAIMAGMSRPIAPFLDVSRQAPPGSEYLLTRSCSAGCSG